RALEALDRLPETHDSARAGIDVRLALRAPLWRAGRLDRLAPIFDEVQTLARRHGEQERLDAVAAFLTQFYWASGDYAKSIEYGERCLAMADARDDLGLRVSAHFYIGHAWASSGRLPEARAQYARGYALLGSDDDGAHGHGDGAEPARTGGGRRATGRGVYRAPGERRRPLRPRDDALPARPAAARERASRRRGASGARGAGVRRAQPGGRLRGVADMGARRARASARRSGAGGRRVARGAGG